MEGNKQNNVIETGVKAYSAYKKVALLSSIAVPASFFLIILIIIIIVIGAVVTVFGADSSNSSVTLGSGKECGFTISDTSLSKSEFKKSIQEYANTHKQWQIFADHADDYYDYAKVKGVNPELVITVASKEGNGYETQGTNNYWGLECPNGSTVCASYSSFMTGAKKMIDSASGYSTLREWFEVGSYSYIGYFWYNPGNWGDGGCVYASYIYPDGIPDRVAKACSGSICTCDKNLDPGLYQQWKTTGNNPKPGCTPTIDEDQEAYTTFLINDKMGPSRKAVFGLEFDEGVACRTNTNVSSSELIENYVQWMIDIASDDTIGYSLNTRYMNPNVDCSSFVYYALLKGAGFSESELKGSDFTTRNMADRLTSLGFKAYPFKSIDELQRGDILWRSTHTEVYVGDGKNVGAHTDYDDRNGDSSGNEVNVQGSGSDWTTYFRYEGDK